MRDPAHCADGSPKRLRRDESREVVAICENLDRNLIPDFKGAAHEVSGNVFGKRQNIPAYFVRRLLKCAFLYAINSRRDRP